MLKVLGYQESKQMLNIYAVNSKASNTWSKTLKTARRKTKVKSHDKISISISEKLMEQIEN